MTTDLGQTGARQGRSPPKGGVALNVAIILLPLIFVWFLLRKGHSAFARVAGFTWLIAWLMMVTGSQLSGSSFIPAGSNQPTTGSAPQPVSATANPSNPAAPPSRPAHYWTYQDGQEYGYAVALSEEDKLAGRVAGEVKMFRYLGKVGDLYTVANVVLGSTYTENTASCKNPCQVVRVRSMSALGGSEQFVTFEPTSVVGEALQDAMDGKVEVYGSASQTSPPQTVMPPLTAGETTLPAPQGQP